MGDNNTPTLFWKYQEILINFYISIFSKEETCYKLHFIPRRLATEIKRV